MNIGCFIDYDNLNNTAKRNGILDTVTRIATSIESETLHQLNRLHIRLYGGWYNEQSNLTINAQTLSLEIEDKFPSVVNLNNNSEIKQISCSAELAFSLLEIPGDVLHSTFRNKAINYSIRCLNSHAIGCEHLNCLADSIHNTLKSKVCSNSGCEKSVSDFIHRNEQKMVDTLLTCDLMFSQEVYDFIILVSSDDDFVPVIKTLLNKSNKVLLVETRSSNNPIAKKFSLRLKSINLI